MFTASQSVHQTSIHLVRTKPHSNKRMTEAGRLPAGRRGIFIRRFACRFTVKILPYPRHAMAELSATLFPTGTYIRCRVRTYVHKILKRLRFKDSPATQNNRVHLHISQNKNRALLFLKIFFRFFFVPLFIFSRVFPSSPSCPPARHIICRYQEPITCRNYLAKKKGCLVSRAVKSSTLRFP